MNAENIVYNYVMEMSKNGVEQHSDAWKELRKYGIGGSQIAKVIGTCAYGTLEEYLHEKVGITSAFSSNEYTQWGNLFEDLIKTYVELDKNCKIFGENLFDDSKMDLGLYYSPDGIAVINGEITLLEFKCPFKRKINNSIPDHYLSQVQLGLDIINICAHGLYVEGVFRYCSLKQMNFGKDFNMSMNQSSMGREVKAVGFIGFKWKAGTEAARDKYNKTRASSKCETTALVDFGDKSDIKELLALCDSNVLDYTYNMVTANKSYPKSYYTAEMYLQEFKYSGGDILGVLPWKLLRVDYHKVERCAGTGFIERHRGAIENVVKVLRACRGKTRDECKKIVEKSLVPEIAEDKDDISLYL